MNTDLHIDRPSKVTSKGTSTKRLINETMMPERALWLAVLQRQFRDLIPIKHKISTRGAQTAAALFLTGDSFELHAICAAAGEDADYVRRCALALIELRDHAALPTYREMVFLRRMLEGSVLHLLSHIPTSRMG